MKNILITGAAGFIGSHVAKLFANKYPNYNIIICDKLSYAADINNIIDIVKLNNVTVLTPDVCNYEIMKDIFDEYNITHVIHLAAESHVDNSIVNPFIFEENNVMGTLSLLHCAKEKWAKNNYEGNLFYHISTDEVYGALGKNDEPFTEKNRYEPHSPYSASKAAADHFVRAYHDTYGLPTVISNCSNNYGPHQHEEKLIPLCIKRIINEENIPVYGTGENIRDWLYVGDHARAIDTIFHKAKNGETYNIGGNNEMTNIDIINLIIKYTDELLGRDEGYSKKLITFVTDRPGHDLRYAINSSKLQNELGWRPMMNFNDGLKNTIKYYLSKIAK
jgi:dTDP-glucose 4,6-dehydratase